MSFSPGKGRVSHSAKAQSGLHRDPFAIGDGGKGAKLLRDGSQSPSNLAATLRPNCVKLTPALIEGFVDTYLAHKYDHRTATPEFHRTLWGLFCTDEMKVVAAAPRGHAKSTAITEAYALADILFRNSDYLIIVSETHDQAVEFIREYKLELQTNDQLIEDFGIKKFIKDTEDDIIVQFDDGAQFRVKALASEGAVRGVKWNKKRPNKIIFDDIEGDEQVESAIRREKLRKWFFNALLPAGGKECKVRGVGTIMHFDSMLARLLKNKTWKSIIFRAHKSFDDFSEILWPEMFSEERLREIKLNYTEDGNAEGYSREYLNEPVASGKNFFRPEDLLPLPLNFDHSQFPKYASWDFAVGEKQKSDYTVCTVTCIDDLGHAYVIDVRRDRIDTKQIIEEIFLVEDLYHPEVHFMEEGVIRKSLGPFLFAEMGQRHIYPILELIPPVGDKIARARSWQGKVKAHHTHYDKNASWWPDLLEELTRFPKAAHDDQVDTLSQLGLQLANINRANSPEENEEEEYQAMLREDGDLGRSSTTGY